MGTFQFIEVIEDVLKTCAVPKPLVYFSSVCVTHVLIRAFLAQGTGTEKTAIYERRRERPEV